MITLISQIFKYSMNYEIERKHPLILLLPETLYYNKTNIKHPDSSDEEKNYSSKNSFRSLLSRTINDIEKLERKQTKKYSRN